MISYLKTNKMANHDAGFDDPAALPRPAVFAIEEILRQRNELREVLEFEFVDRKLVGAEFDRLVDFCHTLLRLKPHALPAVFDSVRYLVGHYGNKTALWEVAWRLAGNRDRLQLRTAVPPWQVQTFREWVPVQVIGCTRQPARRRYHPGGLAILTFRILAGTSCPKVITKAFTFKQCRLLARYLGFSKMPSRRSRLTARYPYRQPEQLVNLRYLVLVDPALCRETPDFRIPLVQQSAGYIRPDPRVVTAACREHNKEQMRLRARIDPGYGCPQRYPLSLPCVHCHVGYLECPAGTHRANYVRGRCRLCLEADAWFDPDVASDLCVNCQRQVAAVRPTDKGSRS